MPLDPTLQEQELLADTFRRSGSRMTRRELVAEVLVGSGFLLAVAGLWLIRPPHAFAVAPAGLCLVVLVLATRVRFDASRRHPFVVAEPQNPEPACRVAGGIAAPAPSDPGVTVSRHRALLTGPSVRADPLPVGE
jgi:hypothetical protein